MGGGGLEPPLPPISLPMLFRLNKNHVYKSKKSRRAWGRGHTHKYTCMYITCMASVTHLATDFFPGVCWLATQSIPAIIPLCVQINGSQHTIVALSTLMKYIRRCSTSKVSQCFNSNCCGLFCKSILVSQYGSCVFDR